ncbi:hypothetical protein [Streptomyces sp. NPDC002588]|uniref:hypothetical protein n=1 Tax=Streptomyces sp. NPDC002588 TaxID=3154419 RepID=UPI00332C7F58
MRVAPVGGTAVQDHVALAEIELCGELIIAASAAGEERLSMESIDEVLRVAEERGGTGEPGASEDGPGSGAQ